MSESVNKVDKIISDINSLTNKEKRELTIKVRTTPDGINAYTSFLYGIGGKATTTPSEEDPNCDDPTHNDETPTDTNENSENSSEDSNTTEEWL